MIGNAGAGLTEIGAETLDLAHKRVEDQTRQTWQTEEPGMDRRSGSDKNSGARAWESGTQVDRDLRT